MTVTAEPDAPPQVRCVLVTGASWGLGTRVVERLRQQPGVEVYAMGRPSPVLDAVTDLMPEHVDVVVHLAAGDHDALAKRRTNAVDGTAPLLQAATERGATAVVLLSSALVYGAWPNNPVPLTEDAVLRPGNAFAFARQLAVVEQMVDDWRSGAPGRTTAVMRPVPAMAANGTTSLARALADGIAGRLGEDDVPAQFIHLDDLADAVVLAVDAQLDGVFNVAPDGWVPGPRVRALAGKQARLRVPERFAGLIDDLRWRFQRGPIPPGLRPYTQSPWMVANDRLRSAGWSPSVTNEQAFVEGTEARWWTMLTPKRKQELALGAMGVAGAGAAGMVAWAVRTVRRRRRA